MPFLLQQRLQAREAALVFLRQREHRFGAVGIGKFGGFGRWIQQGLDAVLACVGKLDQTFGVGEQLDGQPQLLEGVLLFGEGCPGLFGCERLNGLAHGVEAFPQERNRLAHGLGQTLLFRRLRRRCRRDGLETAEHAAGAGGHILLPFAEVLQRQPRRRFDGLVRRLARLPLGQRAGLVR